MNLFRLLSGILLLILSSPLAAIQENTPLSMPDKKNLYQRVLTLPGAKLYPQKNSLPHQAISLPPFSLYYIYQRVKGTDGQEWLQAGLGRRGNRVGWIVGKKTLEWNQGLTLTFRDPTERDRVLLFKDKKSIQKIAENYDVPEYQRLYNAASQEKRLKGSPVVAIQPSTHINLQKNFYLLPIHDYEEIYLNNSTARLLQVSSIPIQEALHREELVSPIVGDAYTAGIVFAIDSTFSMQPYIDRTRQAVQMIYDRLERESLLNYVNFGLVAFRDNPKAAPGIDYLTRSYINLKKGRNAETFLTAVTNLNAAARTSKDFIEDSYAGIKQTIQEMDWSPYAARYIVLITDAGARKADDPLSGTGLSAVDLKKLAQENNAAIFVLHLLTPDPGANHEAAALQYRQLSDYPGIGSLYYGVPTGNPEEFGEVLESLANQITTQIGQFTNHRNNDQKIVKTQQLEALQAKVAKLGHALRMRFLQANKDEQAPDTFKAWLLDKDFRNPENTAVDVCVLLTRDQLSDLYEVLKQVLVTAEQGLISPKDFLNELKSLAATLSRDPEQIGATTATTTHQGNSLADMGFMREYIDGLPYTGEVMELALDDWQSWPAKKQVSFMHRLEEKITYYRALHDHTDLWISLDGGAIDGGAVFPVPLDMLP
ncbi:MAG: vWA domain-containing protein [Methylococcales bacterium]